MWMMFWLVYLPLKTDNIESKKRLRLIINFGSLLPLGSNKKSNSGSLYSLEQVNFAWRWWSIFLFQSLLINLKNKFSEPGKSLHWNNQRSFIFTPFKQIEVKKNSFLILCWGDIKNWVQWLLADWSFFFFSSFSFLFLLILWPSQKHQAKRETSSPHKPTIYAHVSRSRNLHITQLLPTRDMLSHKFRFWKWADFSLLDICRQDIYEIAKDHEVIHFAFCYTNLQREKHIFFWSSESNSRITLVLFIQCLYINGEVFP